jgi:hypothetical protein
MRLASIVLLAAPCCWAGPAVAQMGDGWVPYDPPSVLHLDGANGIEVSPGGTTMVSNAGASFSNAGGIETFMLNNPISNRAERRIQNTYLSGRRQFEGEVRFWPPTNDESVMQIFGGNSGATTQMIRAFDEGGGTLKKMPGSVVLIDKVHGVWVKVNVIHDVGANVVKTYINGQLVSMGDGEATNAGTDGWYHKYGCYGTLKTASAKVEWRNVRHFRDGASPADDGGASTGGPSGGGPSDAGDDASDETRDAAADAGRDDAGGGRVGGASGNGGAAGTGGASGGPAPGTGGRLGSGGARATGGAGGSETSAPLNSGDSACRYAGARAKAHVGPGAALSLAVLLSLALRRAHQRRRAPRG